MVSKNRQGPPRANSEEVLRVLLDEDSRDLFQHLGSPKTIPRLVEECEVSRSAAYRKTRRLEDLGLVEPVDEATDARNIARKYQRSVDGVRIRIHDSINIEYLD